MITRIMANYAQLQDAMIEDILKNGPKILEQHRSKTFMNFFDPYSSIPAIQVAEPGNLEESLSPLMRSNTLSQRMILTKEQFKGIPNLFKSLPDYHPIAQDTSEILNKG